MESPPPTNKVQLQRLLGKINFLRRFIANLAGKIQLLTPLLRLKDKEEFEWAHHIKSRVHHTKRPLIE